MIAKSIPDTLLDALRYDQETGQLFWKRSGSGRRKNLLAGCTYEGRKRIRHMGKNYPVSRIIWTMINGPIPEEIQIDHRDITPSNNRLDNLRLATVNQNGTNKKKEPHKTSKYKGVCWNKRDKIWRVAIRINGKIKHLGNFHDEYKAHLAYADAAKQAFGEFARVL